MSGPKLSLSRITPCLSWITNSVPCFRAISLPILSASDFVGVITVRRLLPSPLTPQPFPQLRGKPRRRAGDSALRNGGREARDATLDTGNGRRCE